MPKKRCILDEYLNPPLITVEDLRGKTEPLPPKCPAKSTHKRCLHPHLIPGLDADWCPDCRRSLANWDSE